MASPKNAVTDQRSAAREKVRAMQAAQVRSQRRQRSLIITAAVVVAAVLVALVVFAVARAQGGQPDLAKVVVPTGVSQSGGITKAAPAGTATSAVKVTEYLDYQCPACQQFEAAVGPWLGQQVAAGAVQVEYHPLNFLRARGSSTDYSLRSANAAYCLADDGKGDIAAFSNTLYAKQPPERGAGLSDADLVAAARQAGASAAVKGCITSGVHSGYVNQQTSAAGIQATPTVLVDGKKIENSLQALQAAFQSAQK